MRIRTSERCPPSRLQEGATLLAEASLISLILNSSAAALVLIEQHWALPLRDAIAKREGSASPTGSSARWT